MRSTLGAINQETGQFRHELAEKAARGMTLYLVDKGRDQRTMIGFSRRVCSVHQCAPINVISSTLL